MNIFVDNDHRTMTTGVLLSVVATENLWGVSTVNIAARINFLW